MARKPRRKKRVGFNTWSIWKKIGVIFGGTLAAVVATGVVFVASKMTKVDLRELDVDELNVAQVDEDVQTGYLNIALLGLDSRAGDLGKGNRSDTMIIASLNKETKEIRMVSIYRDTLLELDDGSLNKANSAYSFGGPEGAISLINRNLDMNIEKYVAVNFNALVDIIDAVGGLDLHLSAEEVVHMNNYCVETSEVTGKEYTRIDPEVEGDYHLNGVQAVSYSRIRYTDGGDFARAERQRIVLEKIAEKVQTMNLSTINKIIDSVFPQVSTNFTLTEMITYAKDVKKYTIGKTIGFPYYNSTAMINVVGSIVVPETLSKNVKSMHNFLFGKDGYAVSDTVNRIDSAIAIKAQEPYTDTSSSETEEVYYDDSYDDGGYDESYNNSEGNGYDDSGTTGEWTDGGSDDGSGDGSVQPAPEGEY